MQIEQERLSRAADEASASGRTVCMRRLCLALLALGLVALSVVVNPQRAAACDCTGITTRRAYEQADAVFVGTVLRVDEVGPRGDRRADIRFSVERVFKGTVYAEQVVASAPDPAACGLTPQPGSNWVIFAVDAVEGRGSEALFRLRTTVCSGNLPTSSPPRALGAGTVASSRRLRPRGAGHRHRRHPHPGSRHRRHRWPGPARAGRHRTGLSLAARSPLLRLPASQIRRISVRGESSLKTRRAGTSVTPIPHGKPPLHVACMPREVTEHQVNLVCGGPQGRKAEPTLSRAPSRTGRSPRLTALSSWEWSASVWSA